jgi:hypothetical protein
LTLLKYSSHSRSAKPSDGQKERFAEAPVATCAQGVTRGFSMGGALVSEGL